MSGSFSDLIIIIIIISLHKERDLVGPRVGFVCQFQLQVQEMGFIKSLSLFSPYIHILQCPDPGCKTINSNIVDYCASCHLPRLVNSSPLQLNLHCSSFLSFSSSFLVSCFLYSFLLFIYRSLCSSFRFSFIIELFSIFQFFYSGFLLSLQFPSVYVQVVMPFFTVLI